jgi:hypothetical protein
MSPKTVIASAPDISALQVLNCVHKDATTIWVEVDI